MSMSSMSMDTDMYMYMYMWPALVRPFPNESLCLGRILRHC